MRGCYWLLVALGLVTLLPRASGQSAPSNSVINAKKLDQEVERTIRSHGSGIEASLWIGGSSGKPWYTFQADTPRPAASAIKTAYLIELFSTYAGKLDDPLSDAPKLFAHTDHPAWAPFNPAQRSAAKQTLEGASVRRVGAIMMGKAEASNDVYNAAANLTTAVLGGPTELTRKIHQRDPMFQGINARRYMLADRLPGKDNDATAASLAEVIRYVSSSRGPDKVTAQAMREAMEFNKSDAHYFKPGSLASNPLTEVRTGWYETKQGNIIYVAMTLQPNPGTIPRADARKRLEKTSFTLRDLMLEACKTSNTPKRK